MHVPLKVGKEVIDLYVKCVASDSLRDRDLGNLEGFPDVALPSDVSCFSHVEFNQVVLTQRNAFKPGPKKILYKEYKRCRKIKDFLYGILISKMKAKKVPLKWRISGGLHTKGR